MAVMKKLVFRISKIFWFIIIAMMVGRALPYPDQYINAEFTTNVRNFIYSERNAETLYDTFSYIDWIINILIVTVIYILTMKLFKKIRIK